MATALPKPLAFPIDDSSPVMSCESPAHTKLLPVDMVSAAPASQPTSHKPDIATPVPEARTAPEPEPEPEPKAAPPKPINMETFQQILELDEDDTHDFSNGMAQAFFSQADSTFKEMDSALEKEDLAQLSSLGHFLKGSSAALGVFKVQASCERIQHYGLLRDEEAEKELTRKEALVGIEKLLSQVKTEYQEAEVWLKNWFEEPKEQGPEEQEPEEQEPEEPEDS